MMEMLNTQIVSVIINKGVNYKQTREGFSIMCSNSFDVIFYMVQALHVRTT